MYQYWGFGLNILSEIEFPELSPAAFEIAHLTITRRKVSRALQNKQHARSYYLREEEFFFYATGTAAYHTTGDHTMVVDTEEEADLRTVRLHILATVIASVLNQRSKIILHACGICCGDALTLICGNSGAGKSTSLAALVKAGYTPFSDDTIVLGRDEQANVTGTASYPMIKLWDDTITKIDSDLFGNRSFSVKKGMDKFGFFFHENFLTSSYRINRVFVLKAVPDIGSIQSRVLSGMEAFRLVADHVYYRSIFQSSLPARKAGFEICASLTAGADVYEILRPAGCAPDELAAHMEKLMNA